MLRYESSSDKIDVPIEKVRAFPHWFGVSVGMLLMSAVVTLSTGSLMVWMIGLTVSVCAWLLDVSHHRLTFDSWRPHVLFWPVMAIVTGLTGGIAGIITIPGYVLEKRIS